MDVLRNPERERRTGMVIIGLILSAIGGLVLAVLAGMLFSSVLAGIIGFIIGWGFLYGQWMEACVPYNIQDIRDELRKR